MFRVSLCQVSSRSGQGSCYERKKDSEFNFGSYSKSKKKILLSVYCLKCPGISSYPSRLCLGGNLCAKYELKFIEHGPETKIVELTMASMYVNVNNVNALPNFAILQCNESFTFSYRKNHLSLESELK